MVQVVVGMVVIYIRSHSWSWCRWWSHPLARIVDVVQVAVVYALLAFMDMMQVVRGAAVKENIHIFGGCGGQLGGDIYITMTQIRDRLANM